MPWVPLHLSGLEYSFDNNGGEAVLDDSTVSYSREGGGTSQSAWAIEFSAPYPTLLRVTASSYAAGAGNMNNLYVPAVLSYSDEEQAQVIQVTNEASPYPASNYPDDDGVTAWVPSPMELELEEGIQRVEYQPTRSTSDELPDDVEYAFVFEVWEPEPTPPPEPEPCEEYGRATRAFVSGYQRDRVHRSRLLRGERRCLVANFNGAIPPARTISRVIWRCDQNQAVYMENARVAANGREVAVDITAQIGCGARVKCLATLDNGEVYTQLFIVRVVPAPYFMGEPTWYPQGPTELTATA